MDFGYGQFDLYKSVKVRVVIIHIGSNDTVKHNCAIVKVKNKYIGRDCNLGTCAMLVFSEILPAN